MMPMMKSKPRLISPTSTRKCLSLVRVNLRLNWLIGVCIVSVPDCFFLYCFWCFWLCKDNLYPAVHDELQLLAGFLLAPCAHNADSACAQRDLAVAVKGREPGIARELVVFKVWVGFGCLVEVDARWEPDIGSED